MTGKAKKAKENAPATETLYCFTNGAMQKLLLVADEETGVATDKITGNELNSDDISTWEWASSRSDAMAGAIALERVRIAELAATQKAHRAEITLLQAAMAEEEAEEGSGTSGTSGTSDASGTAATAAPGSTDELTEGGGPAE